MKTFALAGNPNSGKTTLFNALTGSTAHVGNWPGVTVEQRNGVYKNKKTGAEVNIMDLPGIYSLSPYTPEEVVSRTYILDQRPDAIIDIVDATNLERNLYLTTQLLEMDVPVIVALNMIDAVEKNGDSIDADKLSKELGVPVVAISALKEKGINELMSKAIAFSEKNRAAKSIIANSSLKEMIEKANEVYNNQEEKIVDPLFHAIKALERDEIEEKSNPKAYTAVSKIIEANKKSADEMEAIIADERYKYITSHYSKALQRKVIRSAEKLSSSDKADRVLTNKWAGIPIFLVILFLVFHLTFSEDLLWLSNTGWEIGTFAEGSIFEGLFYADNGICSLGVILANFLNSITGWFTEVVRGWLDSASAPALLTGFVCDGVLGGVFAVAGFLPQILLLFLFFSIMEDSGYMARVAFILDRLFRRFGLSGRAVLPMIMGFGCGVPAMINTRTLNTDKERTQTIRVIPFFSCSAKLPILVAIAGAIVSTLGYSNADVITYSMYLVGIVVAIIAICIMHNTTLREKVPPFIMELPSYHAPQVHALAIHVWDKAKHSVKKLFTIILVSTILVWLMVHITWDWKFLADPEFSEASSTAFDSLANLLNGEEAELGDIIAGLTQNDVMGEEAATSLVDALNSAIAGGNENAIQAAFSPVYNGIVSADLDYLEAASGVSNSILACLGKFVQPVFTPCGFGSQTGSNGWVYSVAVVNGLIAKENVISTFATLSGAVSGNANLTVAQFLSGFDSEGASDVAKMVNATNIGFPGLYAFIAFNVLTIPCFASVATAKGELPKGQLWKTVGFWLFTSYVASAAIYTTLAFVWPVAIWAVLIIGTMVFAILYGKKKNAEDEKKAALAK